MAEYTPAWLTPHEEEDLKKIYTQYGVEAGVFHLNSRAEIWTTIPLKFGVIGQSYREKSCFINTIRDLRGMEVGAAPLGTHIKVVTEYYHPVNPMLTFCYLPTIGMTSFSEGTYLQNIDADSYDGFVIITSTIFAVSDLDLVIEIRKKGKPVYFVRSIVDQDFLNDRLFMMIGQNAPGANMLGRIRNLMWSNSYIVIDRFFFIDIQSRIKYDFSELEYAIIHDLPDPKRRAMILSLTATTVSMIQRKAEELRAGCVYKALAMASLLCDPRQASFRVADENIAKQELFSYQKQLGLDEETLTKRAALMSVDVNSLKEIARHSLPHGVGLEAVKRLENPTDINYTLSAYIQAKTNYYNSWIPKHIVFDPMLILHWMFVFHRMLDIMEKASMDVQKCNSN